MNLTQKPRVFLALYHRGKLSLAPNRDKLGLASFHWALLLTPKDSPEATHMLDVTDAMQIDPVNHTDLNPDRNWIFRDKIENPLSNIRLVLIAMAGKLKTHADGLEELVEAIKKECRVPIKEAPGEHCEWWVRQAVRFLQKQELLGDFDIDATFLEAQRLATNRIDSADIANKRADIVKFTSRTCDVSFET